MDPVHAFPGVENLQAVLDAVSDAVITIDRQFVIRSFNSAAEKLTGHARADVLGRHCFEVLRTEDCRTQQHCPLTVVLQTGQQLPARELAIPVSGNGHTRITITFRPLCDRDGNILGGVETFRPVAPAVESSPTPDPLPGLSILESVERRAIEDVLQRTQWNRTAASRELGISRITLWRKMRKLGIRTPR